MVLIHYYCLHCVTGCEEQVVWQSKRHGYECMFPVSNRIAVVHGQKSIQQRRLFPGYVFVRKEELTADEIHLISSLNHVIRLLCYETGSYALDGLDSKLIAALWQTGGVLDISQGYKEGNRIRIKNGPLKDFEATIVQVNLKRNCVAIQLKEGSLLGKIWCSIEMVEECG